MSIFLAYLTLRSPHFLSLLYSQSVPEFINKETDFPVNASEENNYTHALADQ